MHECSPELPVSVNASIDPMGGVVNHKGGVSNDPSPHQTVIEETKVELSQHYVCYEQARRQLEFLEQGGDPLDFRPGNTASLSVQSTSLTDQHPEQFVISEAKSSFALAASPPGDSDESSGRPGAPTANDPNSADNLMLFVKENGIPKGERSLLRSSRSIVGPSEQSSQLVSGQYAKESDDSSAYGLPKKAYKRRNRSRSNRDGVRLNSTDVLLSSSGHTALPFRHVPRVVKGLAVDADNQEDHMLSSNSNLHATSPNSGIVPEEEPPKTQLDMELDGGNAVELTIVQTTGGPSNAQIDSSAFKNMQDSQHNESLESDSQRTHNEMVLPKPEPQGGSEQVSVRGQECDPSLAIANIEVEDNCSLTNGFNEKLGDRKDPLIEVDNKNVVLDTKGLDLETSGPGAGVQLNRDVNKEILTNLKSIDSNGYTKEDAVEFGEPMNMKDTKSAEDNNETEVDNIYDVAIANTSSCQASEKVSNLESKDKDPIVNEGKEQVEITSLENERMPSNLLDSNHPNRNEDTHTGRLHCSVDKSISEIPDPTLTARDSTISLERQTCSQDLKLETKAHEDAILEEARVVEAKRKRIAELSVHMLRLENRRKSHWDFVLEEMAWLANDFVQERLWKISAAGQIGRQAASTARLKFEKQKQVARSLAKAVMDFWCLVEEMSKEQEFQKPGKDFGHAVHGYALRFLQYNSSTVQYVQAEVATTPTIISNLGILEMSWKDHLTEENLFYSVPAGAMQTYKKSIESHLLKLEKTGICMQEEVETSGYDAFAEYATQENALEEDEGETNTYYMPGAFLSSRPSKLVQKKKKHLIKGFAARSFEMGSDSPFMQSNENKAGNHQSVIIGKRPSDTLNVSIPTKRVRTASRQRVLSPFNAGAHGCLQAPSKTDASSGDTNSFQDDQNILQGGSHILNNVEVESVRNFDRQPQFDSSEVSHKPKKKKKAKNLGSTYEHNWRSDSNFQNEQRDNYKRRLESHQFESNGSSGLYGHHIGKKPKLIKQSLDNSVDNVAPVNCSNSSPVASQMSNMPNTSKFIKMLGGRDRGRKTKGPKTASGQPGSGTSWSTFEDQALVVLVHDLGPNWDLISDAFNSAVKFKCIFRKPKECKERHKILIDSPGEGADSADDSGSSQPYRSTLHGIPKGSARQLFQRLQGPMEEDTIKSHLEKITAIGKKQHHRRAQDPRQLQQPHNSHTYALSQVCPNNLDGGPILTPLDLCDATASSPDVLSLGYQSPHASGLPNSNQGSVTPMFPASGVASSSAVPGSNFSSASSQMTASVRDGRSGIPRSVSVLTDEQQRLQQYNQMLSGRNFQQSNMPVSGVHSGTDRGVRMLTSGNGVGSPNGLNRSMQKPRPGLQGVASSSMVGPGSMLSSGMMALPNPVNIHSNPGAGQGNSMMRPHDPMHLMRPTQNVEYQRQMMIPELQMQVSQGNSQGIAPLGGLNSSFSNQSTAPSVPSYPLHHQQLHPVSTQQSHALSNSHQPHLRGPNLASNAQQQAFAIRVAKERHIQQQRLLQQQQFAASNTLMPHVPGQPQLTVSSPQSQTSSPQVSLSPLTVSSSMSPMSQNPQKHHIPPHIVGRNPRVGGSGSTNQAGKQRQRQSQQQQLQQSGRNHPQQRHQSHSQHQKQSGPSHISHQPQHQQVLYSGQTTSSKQHQQTRTQSENSNQNHVSTVAGPTSTSSQAVPPNQQQHHQSQPHLKLVNQPQPAVQRSLHPNHQVNSDHANKLQARETRTSLHPTNSFSQIASTAPVPSCVDVANVMSTVSSASTSQLKALEQVSDSSISNPATPMGSASTPPLTIEPLPPVRQGVEQIDSSSSLPHVGHDGVVQWSEDPLQLEPPTPPPPLEQQQEDSKQQQQHEELKQQQKDSKQNSLEQSPLLQGGGNSTSPPQLSN